MKDAEFNNSIFVNCPFDLEFQPILQAILFCISYLGYRPRIALERVDSSENRLSKIYGLIENSKYSIHDLSRSIASKKGELFRLNMPFELGIDFGCKHFGTSAHYSKKMLILESKKYQLKAVLSDLADCDVEPHNEKYDIAIRKVRNFLVAEAGASEQIAAAKIQSKYADFLDWHRDRRVSLGFSSDDDLDYPTREFIGSMEEWFKAGMPTEFKI